MLTFQQSRNDNEYEFKQYEVLDDPLTDFERNVLVKIVAMSIATYIIFEF